MKSLLLFMSEYSQQQPDFFGDSHGQVANIPSHIYMEEDQDPLFNQDQTIETETESTRTQTKKREHTAPKILLSVIHKILFWMPNTTKLFHELLSETIKKQNNSTALKLIILAKRAEFMTDLKNAFPSEAEQKLQQLKEENKWTEQRFITASSYMRRIERALNCSSFKNSIEIMWQGNNHPGKYLKSVDDVKKFQSKIRRIKKNLLIRSN